MAEGIERNWHRVNMARWARLELATDGLENRCSVRLSYHRRRTRMPITL